MELPLLVSFDGCPLGVETGTTTIDVLEEVKVEPAISVPVTGIMAVDSEQGHETTTVFVIVVLEP